jgi:nucleotide-binding universal stress UspA family protein
MLERILAATDLSEAADAAVRMASDRARQRGGVLAVCHIVPNAMRATVLFPHLTERLASAAPLERERAAAMVVERVAAVTGRGFDDVTVLVDDGLPDAGIVTTAERWGATLVVMGGQGSGGSRLMLGRVADRVVRTAHCPVLVARSPERTGPVLVATDFSDPALPAVATAVAEARSRATGIAILHSLDVAYAPVDASAMLSGGVPSPLSAELGAELREAAAVQLRAALDRHGIDGETIVTQGPAGPAIVEAAARLGAGLVVVGTTGRTGLARLLLGSVAESVVRQAPCSVLVVRLAVS